MNFRKNSLVVLFTVFAALIFAFSYQYFVSFSVSALNQTVFHPDGVSPYGTFDSIAPTKIEFYIENALVATDLIELTFSADFGTVTAPSVQIFRDTDATPCDGTLLSFTTQVTSPAVFFTLLDPVPADSSICVQGLEFTNSFPDSTSVIPVQTKNGGSGLVTNFGSVFYEGLGVSGSGILARASVLSYVQVSIQGSDVAFGQMDVDTRVDKGPGIFTGGSTITISTNSGNGASVSVQLSQPLKSASNDVISDWVGGYGFGISAQTSSIGVTIHPDFSSGPHSVPVTPSSLSLATVGSAVLNKMIDIAYHLKAFSSQAGGNYSTTLSILVSPNF